MKQHLQQLISSAIQQLQATGTLAADIDIQLLIERTKDRRHGDFACNAALILAKLAKCKPSLLGHLHLSGL